jgi:hypothetical protein
MSTAQRIIPIYTSKGDAEAFLVYPHIYNSLGEWIGWVTQEREVYSILGNYVGYLTNDPRIIRKRNSDGLHLPHAAPFKPPHIQIPSNIPLAPLMSDLSYDTIDILLDSPELLHPADSGELRNDMD